MELNLNTNSIDDIQTIRSFLFAPGNHPRKVERVFQAWADAVAEAGHVERVQLWTVDEAASGIQTSERKIYGDGPGAQQYLLLIEAGAPNPVSLDALASADVRVAEMTGRQDEILGHYWLEIFHETPET